MILEAMAPGLPIVSTRAIGVVDCLRHEDNAVLVEPHDVAGLADAIGRVLDHESLPVGSPERALAEVRARYSWEAVSAQIVHVYRSLLGTSPEGDWPELDALGAPIDQPVPGRTPPALMPTACFVSRPLPGAIRLRC